MSHYSVLVVTAERPTDDVLTKALAPFHEFECTGCVDEYVMSISDTEDYRARYAAETQRRLRDPFGGLHCPYDDEFYRDPTPEEVPRVGMGTGFSGGMSWTSKDWHDGQGYRAKVRFVPDGWVEINVPTMEIQSFAEFLLNDCDRATIGPDDHPDLHGAHKYGWVRLDAAGEVIESVDRTNPHSKWDWWQLGGRWSGFFRLSRGALAADQHVAPIDVVTKPVGLCASAAIKRDVDWAAMADVAGRDAGVKWDRVRLIVGDLTAFALWDAVRAKYPGDMDAARTEYRAQPAVQALRACRDLAWESVDDFVIDRDAYVAAARSASCRTFAFLRDGQWLAKGTMGWFACVSDESTDWPEVFETLLAAVPGDHWVSVVDCHT